MTKAREIWVVDDDRSIRWVLEKALAQAGMRVTSFENADAALKKLATGGRPDAIFADIRMPGTDGLSLLEQVKRRHAELPVIVMTAYADLDRAVAAFQGGAFEYLAKPFDIDDAVAIVQRAVHRHGTPAAAMPADESRQTAEIIGAAPAMQEVFRAIGRLSRSNMTVLITGESGTGKELVARALWRHSPRVDKAFIALNTAAIPRELLESELFGHERGAFTGATQQRIGRFEQAHGGTLFLDEIGDMPAELQTRLLRVLADAEFYRVGGHTPVRVDVRVIAATHQDLQQRVRLGQFREDLYHRLNVIRLNIPPLRERKEDVKPLLDHFLAAAARDLEVEAKRVLADASEVLLGYDWPGNVRQLENVCRWLTVMAPAREIHKEDLPPELRGGPVRAAGDWEVQLGLWADQCLSRGESDILARALPAFERIMIETALKATGGRRQDAAKRLGWGRNTLTRKIRELNLDS
jgi:two-component system nitrogen regulation response regulator GlnG